MNTESEIAVGGGAVEGQIVDAFDDATRQRLIAALSAATAEQDHFLVTKYRGQTLKTPAAQGEQTREPFIKWCAGMAAAGSEPQQFANLARMEDKAKLPPKEWAAKVSQRKAAQPYQIFASLSGNKRGHNFETVEVITGIVLDFDSTAGAVTIDDAKALAALLRQLGVAHYITESSSSSLELFKFHAYIPIDPMPVPADEAQTKPSETARHLWVENDWRPAYHLVATTLRRMAGIAGNYDRAGANPSCLFFVPRIPPGSTAARWNTFAPGRVLDMKAAARLLPEMGMRLPAAALKPASKAVARPRRGGAAVDVDAAAGSSGGFVCLHTSHKTNMRSMEFMAWASAPGVTPRPDPLPDREKNAAGHFVESPIPIGVQIYRIAKFHALLRKQIGPRKWECICPLEHEHGSGRGAPDSCVVYAPSFVDDVENYQDSEPVVEADGHATAGALTAPAESRISSERINLSLQIQRLRGKLIPTKNGEGFASSTDNVIKIMTLDPRWEGVLAWNEMKLCIEKLAPPPWSEHTRGNGEQTGAWSDKDDTRLKAWLSAEWGIEMSCSGIREAVEVAAENIKNFHAVREYLGLLPAWDGVPRVNGWLSAFLGAVDNEYTRKVGRWWLISAVARAFNPGCKVDTMLVLEGVQGLFKSQAIALLVAGVSRRVFSDTPIDFGSKDRFEQIRGVWIYEIAELAGMGKHDAAALKAFMSSSTDTYRRPYGRGSAESPRSCVFVGTVNPGWTGYLKDTTGNRRYWPVAVRQIDREAIIANRDQIWAEALALFQAGERYWPEGAVERKLCDDAAADRTDSGDAWKESISKHLIEVYEADVLAAIYAKEDVSRPRTKITAAEILEKWLGLLTAQHTKDASTRVSKIMSELGLATAQKRVGGQSVKQYTFNADENRRQLLAAVLPEIGSKEIGDETKGRLQILREFATSPRYPSHVAGGSVDCAIAHLRGFDGDFADRLDGMIKDG